MLHSITSENSYHYNSPLGIIFIATTDIGICSLNFISENTKPGVRSDTQSESLHPFIKQLISELDEYFAGKLKSFSSPLDPQGTEFQKKVWNAVAAVPFGEVISYAKLSDALKQPEAIRAVANANARNPLLILIPCHRVIGTDGSLTGYAAGLPRKKFLLELEGALQPTQQLNLEFN